MGGMSSTATPRRCPGSAIRTIAKINPSRPLLCTFEGEEGGEFQRNLLGLFGLPDYAGRMSMYQRASVLGGGRSRCPWNTRRQEELIPW
jgi:hypothetical protein